LVIGCKAIQCCEGLRRLTCHEQSEENDERGQKGLGLNAHFHWLILLIEPFSEISEFKNVPQWLLSDALLTTVGWQGRMLFFVLHFQDGRDYRYSIFIRHSVFALQRVFFGGRWQLTFRAILVERKLPIVNGRHSANRTATEL
jgi:hypothetical protein